MWLKWRAARAWRAAEVYPALDGEAEAGFRRGCRESGGEVVGARNDGERRGRGERPGILGAIWEEADGGV